MPIRSVRRPRREIREVETAESPRNNEAHRDASEDLDSAVQAFQNALDATSLEELLDRLESVPNWLFGRHPRRREITARLMPKMLGALREMASAGDRSATIFLMALLERRPDLQAIFPTSDPAHDAALGSRTHDGGS